mgnify:CR=1 FL=1
MTGRPPGGEHDPDLDGLPDLSVEGVVTPGQVIGRASCRERVSLNV